MEASYPSSSPALWSADHLRGRAGEDVEDRGRALAFPGRHVREDRRPDRPCAAVFVDVTEHVNPRLHDLHTRAKIRAALSPAGRRTVPDARGRTVRDQNVGRDRYERPLV